MQAGGKVPHLSASEKQKSAAEKCLPEDLRIIIMCKMSQV